MIRQRFRHEGDRAAAHLRYGICSRDVDGLYGQGVLFSSFKVCFGSHLPQLPSRSRLDIAAPGFPRALLLPFSAGDNALCMRAFLRAYKVHLERAHNAPRGGLAHTRTLRPCKSKDLTVVAKLNDILR